MRVSFSLKGKVHLIPSFHQSNRCPFCRDRSVKDVLSSRDVCGGGGGGIVVPGFLVLLGSVFGVLQLGQRRQNEHQGRDQDDAQRYEGRDL